MRKSLLITLLTLAAMSVHGQQLVTGKLISDKDGKPVMYANVAMLRADDSTFLRGTITDDKGIYTLKNDTIPTVLRFSAMGYATLFEAVPNTLYGGPTGLGKIDMGTTTLTEGAMLLDMVKIVEKKPMYAVDGEKDLYNVSEDASIQTGNASDALQNAPGVEVDVEGNVTLNGSSVTVWINDRPSHLEGEALKQYIKTLPANSIDRIEVIRNPSARYGGSGPVVNIVTNQKMLKNSFISFGANGSSRPSISPWASYVYSNEKFHISAYVSYSGSDFTRNGNSSGTMMHNRTDTARAWQYSTINHSWHHSIWTNLNASYEFDSMNSISGWFGAYPSWSNDENFDTTVRTDYDTLGNAYDFGSLGHSLTNSHSGGGYGGLWYTHKFNNKGHQYSINANANWWGWGQQGSSQQDYKFQPQMSYNHRTNSNDASGSGSIGFDYSLPYSEKGEISTGVDLNLGFGHELYLRDTLDTSGNYYCDILRSDTNYTRDHDISAYVTWQRKWGDFTLKLGLRGQYSHKSSRHEGLPQYDVTVHPFTVSPSLHMSYRTKDMHNFSLSYTMHTSTPSAESLSSYESFGIESYSTGNPLLEPSHSHNFDASWNKYFDNFGSVGVSGSYKAEVNDFNSLPDAQYHPFFGRVVDFSKPYNVGDTRNADLNFNVMYRPSGFFNVRLNGGVAYRWYNVQVRPGEWVEKDMPSWNVRIKVWTKLWEKVEFFVSGNYSSRALSPWSLMYINEPRKGINLGASADFFDRKLSLYLNCNDIFNWNNWGSTTANPYMSTTSISKWNSRYITFGATLRFGKMELESSAKTGATEESVGNGQ
ncbi:MAG: outer membrane beta-barrel protein [Bacteroidales bacterium]|nr:outer membrane beta-barrel protein [Bacteroidales bacterium]